MLPDEAPDVFLPHKQPSLMTSLDMQSNGEELKAS